VPDSSEHQLFQRKDDKEATVAERLRVYARQTQPVLSYYSDAGLLRTVRAEGALADITQRLLDVLTPQTAKPAKLVKPAKRAAKRRTVAKKKAKSRARAVVRRKAKTTKRRPAAKKRVAVRKVARKAKRVARPVRRKSKRR
jgi:hypothetical protein